jgi:hypothetical protein
VTTMNETPQERIERLAAYWDTHDAPTEGYEQVEQPAPDPMIVFSLRLPKAVTDQLRAREWITQRLSHPAEHSPTADTVAVQLEQLAAKLRAS